jgi:hypothetical protein
MEPKKDLLNSILASKDFDIDTDFSFVTREDCKKYVKGITSKPQPKASETIRSIL